MVAVALEAASRLQPLNSLGKLLVPQGIGELITLFYRVLTLKEDKQNKTKLRPFCPLFLPTPMPPLDLVLL